MSPAKKAAAKKAAAKAKRAAKKAQGKLLGRDREQLDMSDASTAVRAALKVERSAARVKPRADAGPATDSDETVVRVWQKASTLTDSAITDEVADWAQDPTS